MLDWPAQSPDLNPIENLWHEVEKVIRDQKPNNLQDLWVVAEQAWKAISSDKCAKLVDSMPSRCKAVIANNGFATKY